MSSVDKKITNANTIKNALMLNLESTRSNGWKTFNEIRGILRANNITESAYKNAHGIVFNTHASNSEKTHVKAHTPKNVANWFIERSVTGKLHRGDVKVRLWQGNPDIKNLMLKLRVAEQGDAMGEATEGAVLPTGDAMERKRKPPIEAVMEKKAKLLKGLSKTVVP